MLTRTFVYLIMLMAVSSPALAASFPDERDVPEEWIMDTSYLKEHLDARDRLKKMFIGLKTYSCGFKTMILDTNFNTTTCCLENNAWQSAYTYKTTGLPMPVVFIEEISNTASKEDLPLHSLLKVPDKKI